MVEMIRRGEPVSAEDYDRFSNDSQFTFEANEAKKEHKRSPAYKATIQWRNGGKRVTKSSYNKAKSELNFDLDLQKEFDEDLATTDEVSNT